MAFRDNHDALLARVDALQREKDRLERDLDGTEDERDELRVLLESNQKELVRLRAKLARSERPRTTRAPLIMALGLGGVALAGVMVVALMSRGSSPAPDPSTPATRQIAVAPPAPSIDDNAALQVIRACLRGPDLDARWIDASARQHRHGFARDIVKRVQGCDTKLAGFVAQPVGVPEELRAALPAYSAAFTAWAAVVFQLQRYYGEGDDKDDDGARGSELAGSLETRRAELLAASGALRRAAAAPFARAHAERRARTAATGNDAAVAYVDLAGLAAELIDALIDEQPSLDLIEARLAALVAHRDAHPELDSKLVSKFFGFAKDLVRGLREAGGAEMGPAESHAFRMMVGYYNMSGLFH